MQPTFEELETVVRGKICAVCSDRDGKGTISQPAPIVEAIEEATGRKLTTALAPRGPVTLTQFWVSHWFDQ
jgi:hypothetical protein